ncbi:hypothetical protein CVD28_17190 [Bacillus sp. M6-12]|uniref:CBS domain-containing protein n=1 Tax=Bacillus sp. M6-12 TaxID=2054166 RepID=UPI000C78F0E0|nr:hypothetical protein CVD28_17190 [Bacillus sp. M6-12]
MEVIEGIRNYGYSKYPIYNDGKCIGMLTAGTILKWMATSGIHTFVEMANVKVSDIMRIIKKDYHIMFVPKKY